MSKADKKFSPKEIEKMFPTIRLTNIILENFRNVEHGEIMLCNEKAFATPNIESNILGIYGQNGSGKTAIIEALQILKILMSGDKLDAKFVDCISVDKDFAKLEFSFNFHSPDVKTILHATYSFCLKTEEQNSSKKDNDIIFSNNIIDKNYQHIENVIDSEKKYKVVVFNEMFYLNESNSRKQIIINTSPKNTPFIPDTKRKNLAGGKNQDQVLELAKSIAYANSKSFIFSEETLAIFRKHNNKEICTLVLVMFHIYASHYLFVLPTKSSALIRANQSLPLFFRLGTIDFDSKEPLVIPEKAIPIVKSIIKNISLVLEQLVPGLAINIKQLSETLIKENETTEKAFNVILVAYRGNKEFPIRYESDGVRRTISILSLLIYAFNNPTITLAIDEFDAGIYEYLLGEILQVMEEYGKGQFIFTSHNLRPLEVINKKFICFTTTNPQNRFYRLKNIAATNNLRDTYFREIMFNDQKEKLYEGTKQFKIVDAFIKAGGGDD